jgi:hypothetical protein
MKNPSHLGVGSVKYAPKINTIHNTVTAIAKRLGPEICT